MFTPLFKLDLSTHCDNRLVLAFNSSDMVENQFVLCDYNCNDIGMTYVMVNGSS